MLQETPCCEAGLVLVRGGRWRVLDVTPHQDCEAWRLAPPEGGSDRVTLLVPFDRPRRLQRSTRPREVGRRRWMAALRALAASVAGVDELHAAAAASIDLHPYQLEPVLACLDGATRILVADEVGLGKTIQAGLIISELAARGEADRVLVLAPAGLCIQWRQELMSRFHLEPIVVEAGELRRLARWPSLAAGPWQRVGLAVASLDFVKRPEVLRGMSPARYDLLVVDEAHVCAHARERAAAVGWLARRSRRVVLLTATPHDGNAAAFEALCGIGRLEGDAPLLAFRRTRRSLGKAAGRRVHLLRLRLSPAEKALHAALERYTSRVWRARADDPLGRGARLAMVVLRKRAASGPVALLLSLSRRLEWLSRARGEPVRQLQLPLAMEGDLDDEDAQPDALLAAPGFDNVGAECRALGRLVEAARLATHHDTKVAALKRLLALARQPAIVFTEYRDTLDRLAGCLRDCRPPALLHGGMTTAERHAAVRAFNDGTVLTLLATDAAAHGLNLQSRCRLVVNVELPWNPVRLEQRIGRVDRIGQQRRVHGFNLVAAGTGEDRVLARLAARIERVRSCLASPESLLGRIGEEEVAEAVFQGRALELAAPASAAPAWGETPSIFREAACGEVERLERVRGLLRGPGAQAREGSRWAAHTRTLLAELERRSPWVTAIRRRPGLKPDLAPGTWFICRASVTDGRGRVCDQRLLALHTAGRGPSSIAAVRPSLERLVQMLSATRVPETAGRLRARADVYAARERGIAAGNLDAPRPVQAGLFDRRALARAERAAADRERCGRELALRLRDIEGAAAVAGVRAELLLVLHVGG